MGLPKLPNFGHFSTKTFFQLKLLKLHVSRHELPNSDLSLTKMSEGVPLKNHTLGSGTSPAKVLRRGQGGALPTMLKRWPL